MSKRKPKKVEDGIDLKSLYEQLQRKEGDPTKFEEIYPTITLIEDQRWRDTILALILYHAEKNQLSIEKVPYKAAEKGKNLFFPLKQFIDSELRGILVAYLDQTHS